MCHLKIDATSIKPATPIAHTTKDLSNERDISIRLPASSEPQISGSVLPTADIRPQTQAQSVSNHALEPRSLLSDARLRGCLAAEVPRWKTSRLTVVTIGRLQFNVQVAVYALVKRIESIVRVFIVPAASIVATALAYRSHCCCCSFGPLLTLLLHIISFVVIVFAVLVSVILLPKEILPSTYICAKNHTIAVDAVAVGDDEGHSTLGHTTNQPAAILAAVSNADGLQLHSPPPIH